MYAVKKAASVQMIRKTATTRHPGGYPRRPFLPDDAATHEIMRVIDEIGLRKIEGLPRAVPTLRG